MTLSDLKAQMDKLEQLKANLPPEAQKELDHQGALPAYTFKQTSGGDKVAGIACENYQIKKDDKNEGTACLAALRKPAVCSPRLIWRRCESSSNP